MIDSDLITGNEAIDSDHEKILNSLNMILSKQLCDEAKISNLLLDHIFEHFLNEELLMENSKYIDRQDHEDKHSVLLRFVSDIYSRGEISIEADTICRAIKNHIQVEDKKFALWLRSKSEAKKT